MAVRWTALTAVAALEPDDGHETGANSQRAAGTEARGAGGLGRSRDNDRVAALILMHAECGPG